MLELDPKRIVRCKLFLDWYQIPDAVIGSYPGVFFIVIPLIVGLPIIGLSISFGPIRVICIRYPIGAHVIGQNIPIFVIVFPIIGGIEEFNPVLVSRQAGFVHDRYGDCSGAGSGKVLNGDGIIQGIAGSFGCRRYNGCILIRNNFSRRQDGNEFRIFRGEDILFLIPPVISYQGIVVGPSVGNILVNVSVNQPRVISQVIGVSLGILEEGGRRVKITFNTVLFVKLGQS